MSKRAVASLLLLGFLMTTQRWSQAEPLADASAQSSSRPHAQGAPLPSPASSAAGQQPFYVTLAFHLDVPFPWDSGPTPETAAIEQIVDELTARSVQAHLGFQATVAGQLAQAFPDTVAQIQAAQMPIAYHVGPGHNLEALYLLRGPQRSCNGPEDCFAAQWEYETHALYPLSHPQASQPITPAQVGGWLALEQVFGLIPLSTDSHGDDVMYRLLGSRSYELSSSPIGELVTPSMDYGKEAPEGVIRLPEMGERLLYPASIIDGGQMWEGGLPCQSAARYFGQEPGEDAPALIDPYAWLDILLHTQPRDRINHLGLLTHTWPWRQPGGKEWYLDLVDYMLAHPDDFVIIAEDPAGNQYLPQNGPLPFFQDRYGAAGFSEMLALDPPLEEGLDDWLYERAHPSDPLLDQEFRDLGGPPSLLFLPNGRTLALAEAFQAFLLTLDGWQASGALPEQVALAPIYGPVDAPVYRLEEIPHLPEEEDYGMAMQKYRISQEAAPDAAVVNRQGLPGAGTVDYGWPAVVRLEADTLFNAAVDFFSQVGVYCQDTNRVIQFSRQEILDAVREAPGRCFAGEGKGAGVFGLRRPDDPKIPWLHVGSGIVATTEELMTNLVEGYGSLAEADSISISALDRIRGIPVMAGSPAELYATIRVVRIGREALRRAGRPGLPIMNLIATAAAAVTTIAASAPQFGLRPTDGWLVGAISELKIDFGALNKVAYLLNWGANVGAESSPILGGYCGGPAGTAVVSTAYVLMGLLVHRGSYQLTFPVHFRHGCSTTRDLLWVVSASCQAASRNVPLPTIWLGYVAAGPHTRTYFYEAAAYLLCAVASGAPSVQTPHPAKAVKVDGITPLEARFGVEAAQAAARLDRRQANELANRLLEKYESRIEAAPSGSTYQECYDVTSGKPGAAYLRLYDEVKAELAGMGIPFR